MTDDDIRFEVAMVFYEKYLQAIEVATEKQSELADRYYYYLTDLQRNGYLDLYKNHEVWKPENYIKKVIER